MDNSPTIKPIDDALIEKFRGRGWEYFGIDMLTKRLKDALVAFIIKEDSGYFIFIRDLNSNCEYGPSARREYGPGDCFPTVEDTLPAYLEWFSREKASMADCQDPYAAYMESAEEVAEDIRQILQ